MPLSRTVRACPSGPPRAASPPSHRRSTMPTRPRARTRSPPSRGRLARSRWTTRDPEPSRPRPFRASDPRPGPSRQPLTPPPRLGSSLWGRSRRSMHRPRQVWIRLRHHPLWHPGPGRRPTTTTSSRRSSGARTPSRPPSSLPARRRTFSRHRPGRRRRLPPLCCRRSHLRSARRPCRSRCSHHRCRRRSDRRRTARQPRPQRPPPLTCPRFRHGRTLSPRTGGTPPLWLRARARHPRP